MALAWRALPSISSSLPILCSIALVGLTPPPGPLSAGGLGMKCLLSLARLQTAHLSLDAKLQNGRPSLPMQSLLHNHLFHLPAASRGEQGSLSFLPFAPLPQAQRERMLAEFDHHRATNKRNFGRFFWPWYEGTHDSYGYPL